MDRRLLTYWCRIGGAVLAAVVTATAGCKQSPQEGTEENGQGDGGQAQDGGAPVDTGSSYPDGTVFCERDEQCDDSVSCTRDVCLAEGICSHLVEFSRCDDGVFCNGYEICDPVLGCTPGIPFTCDDDNVCTVDECDEQAKSCVHRSRDFDGDGEVDWHCVGGTDCDDYDAARGARVAEICSDGVDNDCDEVIDEQECGRADYDTCQDALQVDGAGTYEVNMVGASADYLLGCGKAGARDAVIRFSLSRERDVTVTARGARSDGSFDTAAVALRTECDQSPSEPDCQTGHEAQIRLRALPSGDYFILVSSATAEQISVSIELDTPTEAPTHMSCETPLQVSGGGRFAGDFVDVSDDHRASCGFAGSADLVYTFTTDTVRDVVISAAGETEQRMNIDVRTDCPDPDSSVRCLAGAPTDGRLYQLPAGEYFLIVEGPSYREINFDLDISFLDPTAPPRGDGCDDPAPLPFDTAVHGTLVDKQDFVEPSCGFFYRDAVYRFEVDEPMDVALRVDGGESVMVLAVGQTCGEEKSEMFCTAGKLAFKRLRNLAPGAYYATVESSVDASFVMMAETLPVTEPVAVSGNNDCAGAVDIPQTGGLFTGDTSLMDNVYTAQQCGSHARSKDAAFRLELSEKKRIRAELEADFDPVLYRFTDTGQGLASCVSYDEDRCDDDGGPGTSSLLDEELDPGIYYYIVDGFDNNNDGVYTLDVTVE